MLQLEEFMDLVDVQVQQIWTDGSFSAPNKGRYFSQTRRLHKAVQFPDYFSGNQSCDGYSGPSYPRWWPIPPGVWCLHPERCASSRKKGIRGCLVMLSANKLSARSYPSRWQMVPGMDLPSRRNHLYPKPKDFLLMLSRSRPGFSFVLECLCKAQARGQGRQVEVGSAWSVGTSGIEHRLSECRLCWGLRSSAARVRHVGRDLMSRCCTSSPQSVHEKHSQPSGFPAGDKKKR